MAKEWILNLATNRWGLNKKHKVGPVSAWIREAKPRTVEEWEKSYYERLSRMLKERGVEMTPQAYLTSLGERLYVKVTEVVRAEIDEVTLEACIAYIHNLVIDRTFEGYRREIETIYGHLSEYVESFGLAIKPASDELDRRYNVDFIIEVGEHLIGIQIKPVTYRQMPQLHQWRTWMEATHRAFTERFGGRVFIVFSTREGRRKVIVNTEVVEAIREEIQRLQRESQSSHP